MRDGMKPNREGADSAFNFIINIFMLPVAGILALCGINLYKKITEKPEDKK